MSAQTITAPHPAFEAVGKMRAALAELIDACDTDELSRLDRDGVLGLAADVEQIRNRLPVVDHAIIAQCEDRFFPAVTAHRNTADLLRDVLHLSAGEAHGRVAAARALRPRIGLSGTPMPALRPALSEAQRAGEVTPMQTGLILGAQSSPTTGSRGPSRPSSTTPAPSAPANYGNART